MNAPCRYRPYGVEVSRVERESEKADLHASTSLVYLFSFTLG